MLRIYGVPFSVHTRKVIVAAIEKNLDYELRVVVPINPATVPPDWARLSPTGKIPVMEDGDVRLADSTVICAHLDRAYPAKPVYPAARADYVRALWLEEYCDGTVFPQVVHPLFHQTFVAPKVHQRKPDQAAVDAVLREALPRVFGYLDSEVGDGFAADAVFSVADIAIVSNLTTYQYLGFALDRRTFPRLAAYYERTARHPSLLSALRAEQATVESMGLENAFMAPLLD
jgi:glutathione S-transferase